MNDEDDCPGAGKCHGPVNWCSTCEDVGDVCDARLAGQRCDAHPFPETWPMLRDARTVVEKKIAGAKESLREESTALEWIKEQERRRRVFDRQVAEEERRSFEVLVASAPAGGSHG